MINADQIGTKPAPGVIATSPTTRPVEAPTKALFFFIMFWSILVYYPMAHMVWGQGGFLAEIGSVDFAGGNVVHISSGVSALIFAIILGRRKGYENTAYRIHNIPFVALGAFILWFGWFGFNAGSALGANGLAAHAFLTSAIASASAMMSWMLIDVIKDGKPTLVGASTGLVVGLVAITPGAGFVPIWSAFIIGALVSPICCGMITLLKKNNALNFTRPTNDPVISAGVIIANIIWNAIYTKCGIFSAYGPASFIDMPFNANHLRSPMIPP